VLVETDDALLLQGCLEKGKNLTFNPNCENCVEKKLVYWTLDSNPLIEKGITWPGLKQNK